MQKKRIMKTALNSIFLNKDNPMNSASFIDFQPIKSLLELPSFQLDIDNDLMRDIIEELEYRAT